MNAKVLSPLETGEEEADEYYNANEAAGTDPQRGPRYRNDKPNYVNEAALKENEEDGYLKLEPHPEAPPTDYTTMTSPTPSSSRSKDVTMPEYADYSSMSYGVDQCPPWYLTILLGFQHYLILFGAGVAVPLSLADSLCIAEDDYETKAKLVGTSFFICGIATILQTILGVRLPLVQCGAFVYVIPVAAMLESNEWKCTVNLTSQENVVDYMTQNNISEPLWMPRMREVQGAILLSGLFQIILGFSGLIGFMTRFIGPLTIAPTITLIGLALFNVVGGYSSSFWWITLITVILIVAFSQYTKNVRIPCCKFRRGHGFVRENIAVFRLFPVILAVAVTWIFSAILIVTKVLPKETDNKSNLNIDFLNDAPWFRMPYPGQWGMPTLTSVGALGMFSAVLASMMESLGDYYACARIARLPAPPIHAINRGLTIEGFGALLAGAFGFGSAVTTYSENIGAIGITKVASRRVLQVAAAFMILFGIFGKFGAIFATIPQPITGGVFIIMFGMITAIGLSNLQFVDLNSSRNLFIIGFSLFFGLTLPPFISQENINTGSPVADQLIIVLLKTSMFVGGLAGFVLDNTISGTEAERGIYKWREENKLAETSGVNAPKATSSPGGLQLPTLNVVKTYDLPFFNRRINSWQWTKYLPICQTFSEDICCSSCKRKKDSDLLTQDVEESPGGDASTNI